MRRVLQLNDLCVQPLVGLRLNRRACAAAWLPARSRTASHSRAFEVASRMAAVSTWLIATSFRIPDDSLPFARSMPVCSSTSVSKLITHLTSSL
ncbi:hypothetical protein BDZ89DRAFT_336486 [Hymenopellis radicata]|nr:hypothetical protein BDZ89DRAFT_336486 [Hymenopellis radicata]